MKATRESVWRTVLVLISATTVAVTTATANAKSSSTTTAKPLTAEQMQKLGLKTQKDVSDYMTIKSVKIVEVVVDSAGRRTELDAVGPVINIPPTIPGAPQTGTYNPNPIPQAPAGAGNGGTWNPNAGNGGSNGPIIAPTVPTSQGGGGWNGALANITGLDINGWIAIGTVVANIIVANQPVVTTSTPTLSILPEQASNWAQMVGWSLPVVKTYRLYAVNGFGVTTVDVTYKVMWSTNGSFNGAGHYIANLQTAIDSMSVLWGFNVDFRSEANNAVNRGTVADPIPAVGMKLTLHTHTYLKDSEIADLFFIGGDGSIVRQ